MKFSGIIRVDLTQKGQQIFDVPESDRLWLAKVVVFGSVVKGNPHGDNVHTPILAIKIQDRSNDAMPWAIYDGYMNSFSGRFNRIFVTVLNNPNNDTEMFLNTGSGVAAAYCDPDGLSPIVGAGATSTQPSGGGSSTVYL